MELLMMSFFGDLELWDFLEDLNQIAEFGVLNEEAVNVVTRRD